MVGDSAAVSEMVGEDGGESGGGDDGVPKTTAARASAMFGKKPTAPLGSGSLPG